MDSRWALTKDGIYFGELEQLRSARAQVLAFRNTGKGDLQGIFKRHTAGSRFNGILPVSRRPMDHLHAVRPARSDLMLMENYR
jgi:hypothetical protein